LRIKRRIMSRVGWAHRRKGRSWRGNILTQ
jgi:hypothetical protein